MRKKLVVFLFEISKSLYTKFFKKNHIPWEVTTEDLLQFPTETFGFHLGEFLQKNNFQLIPKVERHDAYHTLTNYGTRVEEEIGLQYLCMGNGKKSPYMYGAILLGTLILPEYISFYLQSYQIYFSHVIQEHSLWGHDFLIYYNLLLTFQYRGLHPKESTPYVLRYRLRYPLLTNILYY